MSPEQGNLLPRFVREIVNHEAFSIGNPWLPDGSQALVIPIVTMAANPRTYVLAEEVEERISAEDLGRIDRLRVRNDSASRVFLRSGVLFRGKGTQSRGLTMGVVMEPRSIADIEVKCVHASQPITAGATLELARATAPDAVHQALLQRDQGLVWESIGCVIESSPGRAAEPTADEQSPPVSDDLVGALTDMSSIEGSAEEDLRRIPAHERQCGVLILDEGGVLAVEVFDSPESWKAVSRAVLQRYAHVLRPSPKSPLKATVDREAAMGLAKDFLNEIARAQGRQMTPHTWRLGHPLGEYTAVEGHVIHLVAFGPEDQGKRESTRGMASPAEFHRSAPIAAGSDGARKTRHPPMGREGTLWLGPQALGPEEAGGGEVAATERGAFDPAEDAEPPPPRAPARGRKVLTSGWDPGTFQALEHYSKKEFRGDRSAALRFLVRNGLTKRGYLGPQSPREPSSFAMPSFGGLEGPAPAIEVGRARMETRIEDLERIAQTTGYAEWLRERARHELERMASATEDGLLRAAARAALDRLPPPPRPVEIPEAAEIEASPATRRGEVPGLLRRGFAASASGNYPQALSLFDEVLEIEASNVAALLGKAVALRRNRKPQEALAGLDLVLRIQPNNAAALLNRGRILQERGDLQGALEAFNRLVTIAPNDWDVWIAQADVLVGVGRDEDALRAYAEALRRNPGDEDLQRRIHALEKHRIAPTQRSSPRPAMPRGVEEGQSYLVKEKRPELSLRLFKALTGRQLPALVITSQPLARMRQEPGLAGLRILGLSHAHGEDVHSPTDLAALSRVIERFVEENRGRGVILLDGIEYLVTQNGFRDTILFVEHLNEFVMERQAILLLPMNPDVLPDREFALLERDLKVLSGQPGLSLESTGPRLAFESGEDSGTSTISR